MRSLLPSWLTQRFQRITSGGRYVPEVDGLRFLAISAVVLFHLHGFLSKFAGAAPSGAFGNAIASTLRHGGLGVQMFFVLSGFILSLPRVGADKPVNLKKYYGRRLTRLEPPYLVAMLGLFVAFAFVHGWAAMPDQAPHLLAGLVYLHGPVFQHLYEPNPVIWSLEVEVQFYLAFPALALLFRLKPVSRRAAMVALTLLFAWINQVNAWPFANLLGFLHYFFAGMLLADLNPRVGEAKGHPGWDAAALVTCAAGWWWFVHTDHGDLLFAGWVFLLYLAGFRSVGFRWLLARRPVRTIGMMCYTIYLLHFPLISFIGHRTLGVGSPGTYPAYLLLQAALVIVPMLMVCAVFFALVEQPCMDPQWPQKLAARLKRDAAASS